MSGVGEASGHGFRQLAEERASRATRSLAGRPSVSEKLACWIVFIKKCKQRCYFLQIIMISFLISIFSLSILLVFHELGHFILARLAKIKVEEFGLGLPPRILSIKKGETIYSLNIIPFGAFVKMKEDESADGFNSKSIGIRAAIILGGVTMNFFIAFIIFLLIFIIGMPSLLMPPGYIGDPLPEIIKYSFHKAPVEALKFMNFIFFEIMKGLKIAFIKLFTSLDVSSFVGPVGILAIASRGFSQSWVFGLYIIGLISYALAIFNFLPIPAVDGGRILFLIIEKIKGKPISKKTEMWIDNISISFLLLLAILVTIKDFKIFY